MKKHLSVLMLAARSTIYKVTLLLALMAAAEAAALAMAMRGSPEAGFEGLVRLSRIPLICAVCFLALCAILTLNGCEIGGSRLRYTLRRLSISEEAATVWFALYNACCFLIFRAIQLFVLLALLRLYEQNAAPEMSGGQSTLQSFYADGFLHGFLPLEDTGRFVRDLLLVVGLGASSAVFSYRLCHKKTGVGIALLAALAVGSAGMETGEAAADGCVCIAVCAVLAAAGVGLWGGDADEDKA